MTLQRPFIFALCCLTAIGALHRVHSDAVLAASADQPAKPIAAEKNPEPNKKPEPAKKDDKADKQDEPGASASVPKTSKSREAAALAFVQAHHAELAKLLEQLRAKNQAEYRKAVGELFRASERLAQLEERNPERYQAELESWQLKSRIQLLIARLAMGGDAETEAQLRKLLQRQLELDRERLQHDRARLEARLAEMDARMQEISERMDQNVEERLSQLRSEALKFRDRKGKKPTDAATTKTEKRD